MRTGRRLRVTEHIEVPLYPLLKDVVSSIIPTFSTLVEFLALPLTLSAIWGFLANLSTTKRLELDRHWMHRQSPILHFQYLTCICVLEWHHNEMQGNRTCFTFPHPTGKPKLPHLAIWAGCKATIIWPKEKHAVFLMFIQYGDPKSKIFHLYPLRCCLHFSTVIISILVCHFHIN